MNAVSPLLGQSSPLLRWAGGQGPPRARNLLIIGLNRLYILDTWCVSPSALPALVRLVPNTNKDIEGLTESHHNGFFQPLRLATPLSLQKFGC